MVATQRKGLNPIVLTRLVYFLIKSLGCEQHLADAEHADAASGAAESGIAVLANGTQIEAVRVHTDIMRSAHELAGIGELTRILASSHAAIRGDEERTRSGFKSVSPAGVTCPVPVESELSSR